MSEMACSRLLTCLDSPGDSKEQVCYLF